MTKPATEDHAIYAVQQTRQPLVLFAHGKESGPWGSKITRLAEIARSKGALVESPDYSDLMDPDARVARLLSLKLPPHDQLILVGSSMGGYASTVATARLLVDGLFLLAPAFCLPGYANQDPTPRARNTQIVHGWNDTVVPAQNSIRFARLHQCELYLLNGDHRLNDALPRIEPLFDLFLQRVLATSQGDTNREVFR